MEKDIITQEINAEYLKGYIYNIRGVRVMLDMDLAKIWHSGNLVGISINLCKSIQKELFINDTP